MEVIRRRTTLDIVVVGLVVVETLAVTSTFTTTGTLEGLGVSQGRNALCCTVDAGVTRAVVRSGNNAARTLTISLSGTTQGSSCVVLVVDFHITDGWAVGTAEVIATGGTGTNTTVIAIAKVTVLVASNVGAVTGNKVMTTAPGRTVATRAILVVSAARSMLEVVGQREQEVRIVTCVTTTSPIGGGIATDQALIGLTRIQLGHHHCRTFVVTLTVERRDAVSITAQLVTQCPTLGWRVVPGVDLMHLSDGE